MQISPDVLYIFAGLDLAAIEPRIVVKVPITMEGVEAANLLKAQGVRVTLTGGAPPLADMVSGNLNTSYLLRLGIKGLHISCFA